MDLNGPAIPAPPGETSILDNPPNNNGLALGVQVFTCVVATLCFLLRIYGRVLLAKKFQAEESKFTRFPIHGDSSIIIVNRRAVYAFTDYVFEL